MKRTFLFSMLIGMLLVAGAAWAGTGQITGVVVDGFGSPVEGAKVSLWMDGVCVTSVVTDAQGAFLLDLVNPGTYKVHAGKPGVGQAVVDGVVVADGSATDVGTMMLVGKGPGRN